MGMRAVVTTGVNTCSTVTVALSFIRYSGVAGIPYLRKWAKPPTPEHRGSWIISGWIRSGVTGFICFIFYFYCFGIWSTLTGFPLWQVGRLEGTGIDTISFY